MVTSASGNSWREETTVFLFVLQIAIILSVHSTLSV